MTQPRVFGMFSQMRSWSDSGLPPRVCQYIEGEPSGDDACKCGDKLYNGSVYCKEHFDLCYNYVPSAEPNAYRDIGSLGLSVGRPR